MVEKSQDMKKNHLEGTVCDGTLKGREVYKIKGVFWSRRGTAWDRERETRKVSWRGKGKKSGDAILPGL